MIESFSEIYLRAGAVTPADLARGISHALLTTFAGLCVAIPTLVAYNYFVARVERMISDMEINCSDVLKVLDRISAGADRPSSEE